MLQKILKKTKNISVFFLLNIFNKVLADLQDFFSSEKIVMKKVFRLLGVFYLCF